MKEPRASVYERSLAGVMVFDATPAERKAHRKKFAGLFKACLAVSGGSSKYVAVAWPSVLGDNYTELILSLSKIAQAGASLVIATPEPTRDGERLKL